MMNQQKRGLVIGLISLATIILLPSESEAGIIKDLYQKITHTNNRTEDLVRESVPVCGNGVFSTPDERSLSPELIFITNEPIRTDFVRDRDNYAQNSRELANEFRFHTENVTLEELKCHGFNPEAPVSILIHGFTSGYPLQAWMSAIVEAYAIGRSSTTGEGEPVRGHTENYTINRPRDNYKRQVNDQYRNSTDVRRGSHSNGSIHRTPIASNGYSETNNRYNQNIRDDRKCARDHNSRMVDHNLFIVNWNYAARGILYPRAVANIPIVASYVTRFINERLLDEAGIDPRKIQLIGHSLGAHLAGFVGKNTKEHVGRIYGLDPAGPCFGTVSGKLYPSSKRLASSDADEVISIHTNSALLGIAEPLGRYAVFIEGGEVQPGCKGGGPLKSVGTLTWDGGDFDTVACSHSRAPNLLTFRHGQSEADDCQMVAYECKDWNTFLNGHCGVCRETSSPVHNVREQYPSRGYATDIGGPTAPVECIRIGLDWQYHNVNRHGHSNPREHQAQRDNASHQPSYNNNRSTTRPSNYQRDNYSNSHSMLKRAANRSSLIKSEPAAPEVEERRSRNNEAAKRMFMKTGDSQPYCVYHYQVILELSEPFGRRKPPMSIILQDSEPDNGRQGANEQNSLSNDEFGNQYNERTYTHLLTSVKKLKRLDHATLLFREGLADGHRVLKSIYVNYMSHYDPNIRREYSSHLCLVRTDIDGARNPGTLGDKGSRYFFKPCAQGHSQSSSNFQQPNSHELTSGSSQGFKDNDQSNTNYPRGSNNHFGHETDSRQPDRNSHDGYSNNHNNQNGGYNRNPNQRERENQNYNA